MESELFDISQKPLLKETLDEINQSLENECYIAALSLALTVPDICGKAEYPEWSGNRDVKNRYVSWYQKYIGKFEKPSSPYGADMPYANGDIIYCLRCSLLHQGNPNIDDSLKTNEEQCRVDKFILSINDDFGGDISMVSYGSGMKIVHRELNVDIINFCKRIIRVACEYYDENKEKFTFFNYCLEDNRMKVQHS